MRIIENGDVSALGANLAAIKKKQSYFRTLKIFVSIYLCILFWTIFRIWLLWFWRLMIFMDNLTLKNKSMFKVEGKEGKFS